MIGQFERRDFRAASAATSSWCCRRSIEDPPDIAGSQLGTPTLLWGACGLGVEHFPNRAGEVLAGEGFLDQINTGIETALMHDGIARISGHVKNLQGRLKLPRFLRELAAVHAGHDDIGQKQTNILVIAQQMESTFGGCCFEHVISEGPERLDDVAANIGVILDDKDAFA